ncbi:hypothetical protein I352_05680 [Cryptococcus deuterogattii MMRL2647]|nr:hypothetical protein I352_05680 [Cryptococcus deuterogattii MMRL2647]
MLGMGASTTWVTLWDSPWVRPSLRPPNQLGLSEYTLAGFLNLGHVPIIRLVGGGQFRKALILLVLTVWITCWTQEEKEKDSIFGERRSKIRDVVGTIYEAVLHLPKPIRRVCIVQIAAFMGWFPYLFYSTTYVAEVMAKEVHHKPDIDRATRAGSLALLIYSFVAIIAGTLLPYLAARDRRLLKPTSEKLRDGEIEIENEDEEDEEHVEMERIREMVQQWKAEAAREGRPLKLPTKLDDKPSPRTSDGRPRPTHARTTSTPLGWRSHPNSPRGRASPVDERTPLTRSYSTADLEGANEMEYTGRGPVAGGTIMGIHNLAIVFPQFIIAVVASIIFKLADSQQPDVQPTLPETSGPHDQDKNGVAWVLRFGGLMAFVGALVSRKVPPTKTEKAMRRRLADMREESAE